MRTVVLPDGEGGYHVETPAPDPRRIGQLIYGTDGQVSIQVHLGADDDQSPPLWGVNRGPHADVVAAMAAIASQLGGTCERYRP